MKQITLTRRIAACILAGIVGGLTAYFLMRIAGESVKSSLPVAIIVLVLMLPFMMNVGQFRKTKAAN